MGNAQQAAIGRPITPTVGSAQVVMGRSGHMTGFWANASGSVVLYDSATLAGAVTPIASLTATVVGWNPFSMEFMNGIVANCSASTIFMTL